MLYMRLLTMATEPFEIVVFIIWCYEIQSTFAALRNLIVHSGTSRCMGMGSDWHLAPLASSTLGPVSAAGEDRRGPLA